MENLTVKLASVAVFKNIAESPVIKKLSAHLKNRGGLSERAESYSDFLSSLYKNGCDLGRYILLKLLEDENEYVLLLSQKKDVPDCMKNEVKRELEVFSLLSSLSPEEIAGDIPKEYAGSFLNTRFDFEDEYNEKLARLFCDGYGIYSKYTMFGVKNGSIIPLESADKICPDDLIGYESERNQVIANTRALLLGKPAANILLCGDAGTGKSSCVKAAANLLSKDGIRLIELQKEQLLFLPDIMKEIHKNPLKFIIFIDDLSFGSDEAGFGTLKAILEGSAAAKANNAVIYATSNRRHLVKESFSDRDGDDIHRADTIAELTSLSERFGLTIRFSKPQKELYLQIVKGLCEKRGVETDENELFLKAEAFALRKGGRSARCARQFADSLV